MSATTPASFGRHRLAPVIAIAGRRPARRSGAANGLKALGIALMFGVGVATSVVGIGLLASVALRRPVMVLPALVVFATLLAWPATVRRLESAGAPLIPPGFQEAGVNARPARKGSARVLQHPAARSAIAQINRV